MPDSIAAARFTRSHQIVLSLVAVLGLASQFIGYRSAWGAVGAPFWDFQVYKFAVDRFNEGLNPYVMGPNGWSFVYPPIVLRFFSIVNFAIVYPTMLAVLVISAAAQVASAGRTLAFAILGFLTGGAGYVALLTGNVTVFAHLYLVSACYRVFKDHGSNLAALILSAAIVFFSAIKIYFLPYVVIVVLLPRRRSGLAAGVIGTTTLIYALQMVFDRPLWALFQTSLYNATLASGDTGYSLYFLFFKLTGSSIVSVVLYELALALLVIVFVATRARPILPLALRSSSDLFAVLALIMALNPRLKEYDLSVLMACTYLSAAARTSQTRSMPSGLAYVLPLFAITAMSVAKALFLLGVEKIGEHYTGGILFSCAYTIPVYCGLLIIAVAKEPLSNLSGEVDPAG